jgi:hypothetical protein
MKEFDAATAAYLASRAGIVARRLIWIKAESRATGQIEALGLWSGLRDQAFDIGGDVRTYTGAGAVLDAAPIISGPGLSVRSYQLGLSAVAPEIEDLVKGYKTSGAPVEVHRAFYHADTRLLVAPPRRMFLGQVDQITFPEGMPGGSPSCTIALVSETRALTRLLSGVKSQAAQALRGGDQFRRFADVSGSVPVYWGEKRET